MCRRAYRNSPLTLPSRPSRRHRTPRRHPEGRKAETRIRASLQHGPPLLAFDDVGYWLQEAMQNFVHEMLHDSPAALRIMSLWKEYEVQATPEARFVKGELPWFLLSLVLRRRARS